MDSPFQNMKLPIFTSTFVQKLCCFTDLSPPYAPPFVFESGFCVPKQETRPVPTILCSSHAKSTWKKIGKLMLVAYISANRQHNQTSTMVSFTWRLIIPDNASLLNLPLPSFLEKKWILMGETPKKEFTRFQNGSSLASL